MSITDELREWFKDRIFMANGWQEIRDIADRIDAEHQKATAGCIHYDPERHYCSVHGDTEHGWVKLPVDADGVPIHVGDKMEFCAFDIEHPVKRTVDGIGKDVFFAWCGERGYQQHDAKRYRHYTPPTVEDVLDEFVARWMDTHHDDLPALKAKYAAKLRLAGEDE